MKYLVTGGAGFIGSHLVDALVAEGHQVRILDDLSTGRLENLDQVSAQVEVFEGSINKESLLKKAMRGVDAVFHLAAMVAVPESIEDPVRCIQLNDLGVFNVYQTALDSGVRRVVFSSSSAIYGDQPVPHAEEIPPRPTNPYAIHKLLGEHYGLFFHEYKKLESVYLRYFNVYGPRQLPDSPYSGVISIFMDHLLRQEPVVIFDDGSQTRDFVYVSDVVEANIRAAKCPAAVGQSINVGSGRPASINELYHLLTDLAASDRVVCPVAYAPPRPGDIRHSSGPVDKAMELLGFSSKMGLSCGLKLTWNWFQAHQEQMAKYVDESCFRGLACGGIGAGK